MTTNEIVIDTYMPDGVELAFDVLRDGALVRRFWIGPSIYSAKCDADAMARYLRLHA